MTRDEDEREARERAEDQNSAMVENPEPKHPGKAAVDKMMKRYFGSAAK
jgi:hypothetical protein